MSAPVSRVMLARVAILHAILTRPGITLTEITRLAGEHLEFMRSALNDLSEMGLISVNVRRPVDRLYDHMPNSELLSSHQREMKRLAKAKKRYDLPIVLERVIKERLTRLVAQPE